MIVTRQQGCGPIYRIVRTLTVMSLQSLISGSECAIPANPLSQVLKHTESDRSLQHVGSRLTCHISRYLTWNSQDRIGAPSTSRVRIFPLGRNYV